MLAKMQNFFRTPGNGSKAPMRVFWVALFVRLAYMTFAHTWRVKAFEDHRAMGFEAGRIAKALVTGFGYADPFGNIFVAHTGPTAWLPPLYPLLMAGVFKVFGLYSAQSAWVLLAINCLFSAATALAVWELGARFDGLRNARWAGWLWALYPAAMQYAVKWFWEMTITTALFAFVLVLAQRMRAEPGRNTLSRWAWFGAGWALIALSNSSLLIFLPICGIWLLLGEHSRKAFAGAVLSGLIFCAIIAPWVIRNERVFHAFIPMRGNFGAELYLGNGPGANGFLMEYNHPFQSPQQLRLYRDMGEVAYVKMRGAAAKQVIAANPWLFVKNTLIRIDFFWASVPHSQDSPPLAEFFRVLSYAFISLAGLTGLALALARKKLYSGLWAWAFLLLPLPYYIVTVHARFRHPLEPLIAVLGVYLFQSTNNNKNKEEHGQDG